jgi:hypothetical protein
MEFLYYFANKGLKEKRLINNKSRLSKNSLSLYFQLKSKINVSKLVEKEEIQKI